MHSQYTYKYQGIPQEPKYVFIPKHIKEFKHEIYTEAQHGIGQHIDEQQGRGTKAYA